MCVLSSNIILIQGLTIYELLPTATRKALKIRQIAEDCHIMDSSTRYETTDFLFWIYILFAPSVAAPHGSPSTAVVSLSSLYITSTPWAVLWRREMRVGLYASQYPYVDNVYIMTTVFTVQALTRTYLNPEGQPNHTQPLSLKAIRVCFTIPQFSR